MRRQRIIQILQYLLVRIWTWLFVVFVMKKSFVDFILQYRVLLLIASISYFYYYSILYDVDKKYKFIRSALIYWNVYIFAHVFFRPLLGINHELFILLWLVILWLWGTTKMKSKWRWVLQVLWWTISFFILISGIFYLYPDSPDIEWFLSTRSYEIQAYDTYSSVPRTDAYIYISWNKKNEDFDINPNFYKELTENCIIWYPSLKNNREEKILITTPMWDIYQLYPQSKIQVDFSGKDMAKLYVINWKIWLLYWLFDSSINLSGNVSVLSGDDLQWLKSLQYEYNEELVNYLKKQISWNNSWKNNAILYKIDETIIRFLCRIFPTSYTKNLDNYNEFQSYFSLVSSNDTGLFTYSDSFIDSSQDKSNITVGSLMSNFRNNMRIWNENTYGVKKPWK